MIWNVHGYFNNQNEFVQTVNTPAYYDSLEQLQAEKWGKDDTFIEGGVLFERTVNGNMPRAEVL